MQFNAADAIALKQFRLAAAYIPDKQNKQALQAIRQGLKTLNRALKTDPDNPRLLLLSAMLDGQWLLLRPWRFFLNGRRALNRLSKAEQLTPDNPRATLLRGTAKVVLPGIFGGNAEEAVALFNQTLAATDSSGQVFEDSALCHNGAWAQVDLLNWLGRAHTKLGQPKQARQAYLRALHRSPDNYWVKLAMAGQGYEWTEPD